VTDRNETVQPRRPGDATLGHEWLRSAALFGALATLLTLHCGRDEADLLIPGIEAGAPPLRDAPPPSDAVAMPDQEEVGPPLDVAAPPDVAPPLDGAGPPDVAPCVPGFAAQFTGASSLSVARPVQDDFTLEAWIKTTASRSGTMFYHGNGLIYADAPPGTNPAGSNDFGTAILNDKFAFGIGNPDTTLQSDSRVTTGEWVHVAATRNKAAGEAHVFVNGVDEKSMTTPQKGSLTDQATLSLGCTLNDQNHFIGLMEEVRIWNVARTEAEIASTMRQRLRGNETGLVAYWRFDDPGGATALDSSPAKADAAIAGTLEWVASDAPICGP
jgi:concanavalin A-like lectin/glucanase superfamily protein